MSIIITPAQYIKYKMATVTLLHLKREIVVYKTKVVQSEELTEVSLELL